MYMPTGMSDINISYQFYVLFLRIFNTLEKCWHNTETYKKCVGISRLLSKYNFKSCINYNFSAKVRWKPAGSRSQSVGIVCIVQCNKPYLSVYSVLAFRFHPRCVSYSSSYRATVTCFSEHFCYICMCCRRASTSLVKVQNRKSSLPVTR